MRNIRFMKQGVDARGESPGACDKQDKGLTL